MNEVPIYMKVAPNIDWSGVFYLFYCLECVAMCYCISQLQYEKSIITESVFVWSRNFKWTISNKQIRILSCMTGVRMKREWLFRVCWFVLLVSRSWRVKLAPEADSSDVQSLLMEVTSQPVRGFLHVFLLNLL